MARAAIITVSTAEIVAALKGRPIALDVPGGMPADARAHGNAVVDRGTIRFVVESPSDALPGPGLVTHGVKVG